MQFFFHSCCTTNVLTMLDFFTTRNFDYFVNDSYSKSIKNFMLPFKNAFVHWTAIAFEDLCKMRLVCASTKISLSSNWTLNCRSNLANLICCWLNVIKIWRILLGRETTGSPKLSENVLKFTLNSLMVITLVSRTVYFLFKILLLN